MQDPAVVGVARRRDFVTAPARVVGQFVSERTTCLYSDDSTVPRSLSAVSQRVCSKDFFGAGFFFLRFAFGLAAFFVAFGDADFFLEVAFFLTAFLAINAS